jgi:hypothetical protein
MGSGNSTQSVTSLYNPAQKAAWDHVSPGAFNKTASVMSPYAGEIYQDPAPFLSDVHQLYQNKANVMQGPVTQGLHSIGDSLSQSSSAFNTGYNRLFGNGTAEAYARNFLLNSAVNPTNNPALQAGINSAQYNLTQNYRNNVIPSISSGMTANNMYGSSRQGVAEGIAAQSYLDQLKNIAGSLTNEGYKEGLGAMAQGFGTASGADIGSMQTGIDGRARVMSAMPGVLQSSYMPEQLVEGIRTQELGWRQKWLDTWQQQYYNNLLYPVQAGQALMNLAWPATGSTVTSGAKGNQAMQTAGAVTAGIGAIASIASTIASFAA